MRESWMDTLEMWVDVALSLSIYYPYVIVDAVVGSTLILEDCPLFNAGCGSVKTKEGLIEMDAGIMDGYTGNVGGCSIVTNVKNPILLAKGVMEKSEHSLLAGVGAESFAKHLKLQIMPEEYFETKLRTEQLQKYLQEMGGKLGTADSYLPVVPEAENGIGTVGAVALDSKGHFAACSSTGGMTGVLSGRVSDSSISGAGFFATQQCAVTATGQGDKILKTSACSRITHLYQDNGVTMEKALAQVMTEDLSHTHVGFIAVDKEGQVFLPFNTGMMFRGIIGQDHDPKVAIFKDEHVIL